MDHLAQIEEVFRSEPPRQALHILMAAAQEAGFGLVWRLSEVRSVEFTNRRNNLFSSQAATGHVNFYLRSPALRRAPGLRERAAIRFGEQKPNKRGEYRIRVHNPAEAYALLDWLIETDGWPELASARAGPKRGDGRMRAAEFSPVTADHIFRAAVALANGFTDHDFAESTDYDVLFREHRLRPKALFGVAATMALGRRIGPRDFSAGLGTPCFHAIQAAGYEIVAKGAPRPPERRLSSDDRKWAEGNQRLVTHLKRERGDGLSQAKRAAFLAEHGRLFCERCLMDPVAHFESEDGTACIEVHHHRTAVAEMEVGHETKLEDLQCLCANCHRFVHRELKRQALEGGRINSGKERATRS